MRKSGSKPMGRLVALEKGSRSGNPNDVSDVEPVAQLEDLPDVLPASIAIRGI